ncbi:MAG: transcription initiation factor IIB, partial [Nitrosarchaeum sp.]|nr:transcription initiation factor IIB [Nitrosarchaeum sp.]
TMPTVNLSQCVVRIANSIGASEKVKRHAIAILQKAEQINIVAGKDPMGLAAAAIYLAGIDMGEHYSHKKITAIAKITSVTIRNRSNELKRKVLSTKIFC